MALPAALLLLLGFTLGPVTEVATYSRREPILWSLMATRSNLTQKGQLPQPWLSVEPVPWITPGLSTFLLCQARLPGVIFLLRRMENDRFLEIAAARDKQAIFLVHQPGTYTCSYQTHEDDDCSKPSNPVTIKEYGKPPPPLLTFMDSWPEIPSHVTLKTFVCEAPLNDVEFQLRHGKQKLKVPTIRTSLERVNFYVKLSDLSDQSNFTCRYRLHRNTVWSHASEPIELMWSDETLPAPVLTAEPSSQILEAGSMVQLRCTAPKAGLRFGLLHEAPGGQSLLQILMPSGNEAVFQLHKISAIDSANYSCIYMELVPPFSGSAPSNLVSLTVNGPPPPPKLQALWTGKVFVGHNVVLRCQSHLPGVTVELLREGKFVPYMITRVISTSSDLMLPIVGPQHTGNYSCRYILWGPKPVYSELSNPVELLVEEI